MNKKERSKVSFDKQSETYDDSWCSSEAHFCYPYVVESICRLSFDTLLDLGCGTGEVLSIISKKKKGCKLYGLDLSEKMLEQAKKKLPDSDTLLVGDSENMPFEDEMFDVLTSTESFHHYPNPKKAIGEIYRVLKKDGTLVLCDFWRPILKRKFMNLFIGFSKDGDVRIYSQKEIVDMLQNAGFKNISFRLLEKRAYIVQATK